MRELLARRMQHLFATVTGSQARKSFVAPKEQGPPPRNPLHFFISLARLLFPAGDADYGDLT